MYCCLSIIVTSLVREGIKCRRAILWPPQLPENASRLGGYKHVCVNYLHVASHDYQYQEVIHHTHKHIHTLALTD